MRFIGDFLKGEKDLLKIANVRQFNIPFYDEFSVANIFPKIREDDFIMKHLPYYEDEKKLPDRKFFY